MQALESPFKAEDLMVAGQHLLTVRMNDPWLTRGRYNEAALWLKNVYWHANPSLKPLEVILKGYDHLPDVPRPDFIPAEGALSQ